MEAPPLRRPPRPWGPAFGDRRQLRLPSSPSITRDENRGTAITGHEAAGHDDCPCATGAWHGSPASGRPRAVSSRSPPLARAHARPGAEAPRVRPLAQRPAQAPGHDIASDHRGHQMTGNHTQTATSTGPARLPACSSCPGRAYTSEQLTRTVQLNINGLAYVVNDDLSDFLSADVLGAIYAACTTSWADHARALLSRADQRAPRAASSETNQKRG